MLPASLTWTCVPATYETMCSCATFLVSGFESEPYGCSGWNSQWTLVTPDPQIPWMEGRPVFEHDGGGWSIREYGGHRYLVPVND